MPSANGVYSLPPGYLAVTGATIQASQHNPPLEDIASALTARLSRDGTAAMSGALQLAPGTVSLPGAVFSTDLTTGFYKTTSGIGVSVSGVKVAEFLSTGLPLADQIVTLPKLFDPGSAGVLLGTNANASQAITAAANNGSGLIRLTVASTSAYSTGQPKIVANVGGTTEANGRWTITVVDSTHIDLQGSSFVNAYTNGGTIGGGFDVISLGAGLAMSGNVLSASLNPLLVPNYLSGLTMSTAGSSATMSIASGVANDTTNAHLMNLAVGVSKTTASWAVGTGTGGLDTGSIANNSWYAFYLIQRLDTGVVDVIFSGNGATPTLPSNYTIYRRIGWGKTNGSGQWTAFTQFGDNFLWLNPSADIATNTLANGATTFTLNGVPPATKVFAHITGFVQSASAGVGVLVTSPDQNNAGSNGSVGLMTVRTQVNSVGIPFVMTVRTNTSAQIVAYADNANTTFNVSTHGWTDIRGKV